jgi:ElaB/YqjD/DUF883 family membrane-anchored ribosome-binding protein
MVADKELEGIKTNVQRSLKTLANELDRRVAELKKQIKEGRLNANVSPNSRQILRLGVAFAVGMAIGIALSKNHE